MCDERTINSLIRAVFVYTLILSIFIGGALILTSAPAYGVENIGDTDTTNAVAAIDSIKDYLAIEEYISLVAKKVPEKSRRQMAFLIVKYSKQFDMDPLLMTAMFAQESTFNERCGEGTPWMGIGQLTQGSFQNAVSFFGWDKNTSIYNPQANIPASIRCVSIHKARAIEYNGVTSRAELQGIVSYNGGTGYAQARNWRNNAHVERVLKKLKTIQRIRDSYDKK